MGQPRVCKECGKTFFVVGNGQWIYCSDSCRFPFKTCPTCGKQFRPAYIEARKRRYCSITCHNKSAEQIAAARERGGKPGWPMYTEVIGKRGHVFIKVPGLGTRGCLIRKAVYNLEQLEGRRLTKREQDSIEFKDGDITNCAVSNLFIRNRVRMRECLCCRETKVIRTRIYAEERRNTPRKFCVYCFREFSRLVHSYYQFADEGILEMTRAQSWKSLLRRDDALAKKGSSNTYDRVVILTKVLEHPGFVEEMKKQGKRPIDVLADRLKSSVGVSLSELLQMMKEFPDKKDWEEQGVHQIRTATIAKLQKQTKKKKATNGRKTPRRVTIEQHETLKTKKKEADSEVKYLKGQLKQANQVIKSLESQLEGARETIGSLNETIALLKVQKKSTRATSKV